MRSGTAAFWLLRHVVALAVAVPLAVASRGVLADPHRFTILYTQGTTELGETQGRGGMARLAAMIRAERAKQTPVLVLHGGQTLAPSVLAFYDQGAHIIDLLNGIGVDAMAALNREFHHGDDRLMARAFEAGFPIITTNAVDRATGKPLDGLEDSAVLKAGPFRVGVLAATPTLTRETASAPRTDFREPVAALTAKAKALRASGVDLIVAMTGSAGNTHKVLMAARASAGSPNFADILLYQDRGIQSAYVQNTPVLAGTVAPQGTWVLAIDVTMERKAEELVWSAQTRTLDSIAVAPDPTIDVRSRAYAARLDTMLSIEVGRLDGTIDTRREAVRTGENAFANAVTDTLRASLDADVALINGGGIRGDREYADGVRLTRRDIYTELPYHDVGVVLNVTGQQLWDAVESGLSAVEHTQGRFPHLSNARVTADLTRPPGQRVQDIRIGDRPLDRKAHYRLATSNFLANGGDGYSSLSVAPRLMEDRTADFVSTQLIAHIARSGVFAPRLDGRMALKR
ncbi:bifunctional metallophosphatase/5'-nucleotidase [Azospirillum griseum]|uniref:Bifunctional metallophosphatase/5'-nucleotidase n=1 Tax=Azospirillum griseum TaxID=2496639 RepID=A0A431VKS8_9PROT|nr:bifunctional metallophosphatase/5'-nucleotidase [Azospirillum griseum]